MSYMKKGSRKKRPNLFDRLGLKLSTNRRIDGLWIGTSSDQPNCLLDRVEEALSLIKKCDRPRYNRLIRDLERVWVRVVPHGLGTYNEALAACELDERFVLADTTSPDQIAATIVHEATHSRLLRCGIGYGESLRARVEAVCFRREIAFAAKLPNGEQVKQSAERGLEWSAVPGYWSDTTFNERYVDGGAEALHYLGAPDWLVRGAVATRALRLSIKKQLRRR